MKRFIFIGIASLLLAGCVTPTNTKNYSSPTNKHRTLPGIRKNVFDQVIEISRHMEPVKIAGSYSEPNYDLAITKIEELEKYCLENCNNYEKSQAYRLYTHLYRYMGLHEEEVRINLDKIIALSPDIPLRIEIDSISSAAKISHKLNKFDELKSYLARYREISSIIPADIIYLIALSYHHEGLNDLALRRLDGVLMHSKDRDEVTALTHSFYELKLTILDSLELKSEAKIMRNILSGLTIKEHTYLPIVKTAPRYPRDAATNRITGYCTIIYDVLKSGKTNDVRVDDCPNEIFLEASLLSASKFWYKPTYKDGLPVIVKDVKNRFTFEIAD